MTLTNYDLLDMMDQSSWYRADPQVREPVPSKGLCNLMGAYDLPVEQVSRELDQAIWFIDSMGEL